MAKTENITEPVRSTAQIDLSGEFRFKVDSKGRVALPSKFRKVLPKDLIVSPNVKNECLYVFTTDTFNDWVKELFVDKFGGYDASNNQHVGLRRKLKARGEMVDTDSSGRITLKGDLRGKVGIEKDVVVIGNDGYFEIWPEESYDAMMNNIDLDEVFG